MVILLNNIHIYEHFSKGVSVTIPLYRVLWYLTIVSRNLTKQLMKKMNLQKNVNNYKIVPTNVQATHDKKNAFIICDFPRFHNE